MTRPRTETAAAPALTRRNALTAGLGLGALGVFALSAKRPAKAEDGFPVTYTEAEWRERLTPEQFRVLREEGTEPPFSSPLNDVKSAGVFHCAGCDNALYATAAKFDSGTGWPSFYEPVRAEAVGTSTDFKLFYPRTEVHCARCGGHQGHIFNDGPEPTGKRHCINGVAMVFRPADGGEPIIG